MRYGNNQETSKTISASIVAALLAILLLANAGTAIEPLRILDFVIAAIFMAAAFYLASKKEG